MKTNQAHRIEQWLDSHGSITPMMALKRFDCFRLAARISDLRNAGMNIVTIKHKLPSGKTVAKYKLAKP